MLKNNIFYVVIDTENLKFLKKSPSSSYRDYLTNNIGEARIFTSEAKARVGFFPKSYEFGHRLKITRMEAVHIDKQGNRLE